MSWQEALEYAQGPGVAIIVAFLLSWAVEYWPWYEAQNAKTKRLLFLGFSIGVPVVASTLSAASGYQGWGFEETWWPALQSGFAGFTAGTIMHLPRLPKEPEPEPELPF